MFLNNFIFTLLTCYLSIENINCATNTINISNDRKIFYRTEGRGQHTLLLIDGTIGDIAADNFEEIYKNINLDQFKLIQVDLPGYGESQCVKRSYPDHLFFEKDADDLIEVMDKLNEKKYSVAGWGYGGTVALVLASKVPQNVIKVIEWGAKPIITEAIVKMAISRSEITDWRTQELEKQLRKHTQEYIIECHKALADGFRFLMNNDSANIKTWIAQIKVPTLLIHGHNDIYTDSDQPKFIKGILKSAKIVTLNGASHSLHNDDRFIDVIQKFLLNEDYPHDDEITL